ncbi:hypothetical protein CJ430_31690, partial [Klebsiella pneumoniae]
MDILSRSASHGYELIKEIETLYPGGTTAPARGVIYPTLDILSRSASHGYELIKEIETLYPGGTTAPARGV